MSDFPPLSPEQEQEVRIGIRCACGTPITRGWEWYMRRMVRADNGDLEPAAGPSARGPG